MGFDTGGVSLYEVPFRNLFWRFGDLHGDTPIYSKSMMIFYPLRSLWCQPVRLALLSILKLEPDSLGVLAPVCSSMGFLASSLTQRSFILPLGDIRKLPVAQGNLLACRYLDSNHPYPNCFIFTPQTNRRFPIQPRSIILCWVLVALGHCFLLEQPKGSHFRSFPHWRFFCKYICKASWLWALKTFWYILWF